MVRCSIIPPPTLPTIEPSVRTSIFAPISRGVEPCRAAITASTACCPAGKIIGLDRGYALEMICGSEVTVEYDKLIDRQLERAAITSISGFAKLFPEASRVLSI